MTAPDCPRPLAALIQNGKQSFSWVEGDDRPAEIDDVINRVAEHHAQILEHNTRAWLERLAAEGTKIPAPVTTDPRDPVKTLRAAMETISRTRRELLTQPDEIRMRQATLDELATAHGARTGDASSIGSIYGIPIIIDDTLKPGRIEARVQLRPGMTAEDIRRLIDAGYQFPPVDFGPITFDWQPERDTYTASSKTTIREDTRP